MPQTTFNVLASGDDGQAEGFDPAYPPPAGNTANDTNTTFLVSKRNTFGDYRITVGLLRFDTSLLPDDAVITAVTLRLYVTSTLDIDNRSLTAGYYDSANWPIDPTDWTSTVETDAHAGTDITGITVSADNDFALQNLASISKTKFTGLRLHVSGGAPSVDGENNVSVAAFDHATLVEPRLIVDYIAPTPQDTSQFPKPKLARAA